jgi:hypothetical protein
MHLVMMILVVLFVEMNLVEVSVVNTLAVSSVIVNLAVVVMAIFERKICLVIFALFVVCVVLNVMFFAMVLVGCLIKQILNFPPPLEPLGDIDFG